MRSIFTQILYELEKKHDLMLVTLVAADGSAPRKTGACMLIGSDKQICGTIGGGPVEQWSVNKAKGLIAEKRSYLHEFHMNEADKDDIGSVCGGNVTALFEYIPGNSEIWQELSRAALERIIGLRGGIFVMPLDGSVPALTDNDNNLLLGTLSDAPSYRMVLPVNQRAILFGGGHVAAALAPLLTTVGFRVTVFDDRPEFVTEERFPCAEKRINGSFRDIAAELAVTAEDYVVIMTNGHRHDLEVELQVLRGSYAYVGVIGSHRKIAFVNEKLREAGISEEAVASVHTPIGTAIKAVTPEEIAVSIAGEMILVRAERREQKTEEKHVCPM